MRHSWSLRRAKLEVKLSSHMTFSKMRPEILQVPVGQVIGEADWTGKDFSSNGEVLGLCKVSH